MTVIFNAKTIEGVNELRKIFPKTYKYLLSKQSILNHPIPLASLSEI